ncbi:transaldolase [Gemmatimonas sp.]|jgi:transaldolase|uniref:transaldolase n=1 Tax=Gemmatimonas sp. TaxID=1962908 RepID=UPI0025BD0F8A|nr:transaldolase [Gemmatimonas sp.]MCA2982263.1 transaldolase [Gemmatimonas sp.]MCA2987013.1 transaldolase [Gemmatimonas sp.]MCA2990819.1 transaldolase [Gemmatimonas sp.]MCA2994530.1 transaldolase [Gemmatimonas sp.]
MSARLHALHAAGQSLWLDYIDRTMLSNGDLARRIAEDALTGMTSNPTIFEKALAEGAAYDAQLATLPSALSDRDAFFEVAATDVRQACDAFRTVYDRTLGLDGFVSLEVSPDLARDTAGTVAEARRLWAIVDRPNLMIKVPGTPEGAEAIRQLIADGINVNVTLLFSVEAHARVIEAYLAGLEARAAAGLPIDRIGSVASFFVSRVDSAIDKQLGVMAAAAPERAEALLALQGKAAIANAKLAYRLFQASFSGARWAALSSRGARVQRPLWASTSTKNPAYRDVIYVEELIGPDTVNTLPPATLEAFRDHGEVRASVTESVAEAERSLAALEAHGVSLQSVTDTLLAEGLASFEQSFVTLLAGLARKRAALAPAAS